MASGSDERRMVFDLRGRRKHVVQAVYAILAILMAASLFLVIGPVSIGEIFGARNAADAAAQFEDRAQAIERQLRKKPNDAQLQAALTRQRISAGNALASANAETGRVELSPEAKLQYEKAVASWSSYQAATDEPSPAVAQLMAPVCFGLAESSSSVAEIESNVACAADAQRIVAEARPSLGSLSTLAIYSYFTFDFPAADKVGREAKGYANTKFERENLENQLEETRKQAKEAKKRFADYKKATKGQGKEALENPFGGLGG